MDNIYGFYSSEHYNKGASQYFYEKMDGVVTMVTIAIRASSEEEAKERLKKSYFFTDAEYVGQLRTFVRAYSPSKYT